MQIWKWSKDGTQTTFPISCRRTIPQIAIKLEIVDIYRHTASFKIQFKKVQDFGKFELSPI